MCYIADFLFISQLVRPFVCLFVVHFSLYWFPELSITLQFVLVLFVEAVNKSLATLN